MACSGSMEIFEGVWCRDCANLFRLMFRAKMTMGLFERWVSGSQENRVQWLRLLISYLSLKVEGATHVSQQQIESRLRVLSWVMELLGLPWPLPHVSEVTDDFLRDMMTKAEHYLTSDGQKVYGLRPAMLPLESRGRSSARVLTQPQASRQWPLLPLKALPENVQLRWQEVVADQAHAEAAGLADTAAEQQCMMCRKRVPSSRERHKEVHSHPFVIDIELRHASCRGGVTSPVEEAYPSHERHVSCRGGVFLLRFAPS